MPLDLDSSRLGVRSVLRIAGRLDLPSADELRAALAQAIDEGPALLVLDLAGVEFLDSTGLGVLVAAHRKAATRSCRMVLAAARPFVAQVLDVTGVGAVLSRFDTVELALAE